MPLLQGHPSPRSLLLSLSLSSTLHILFLLYHLSLYNITILIIVYNKDIYLMIYIVYDNIYNNVYYDYMLPLYVIVYDYILLLVTLKGMLLPSISLLYYYLYKKVTLCPSLIVLILYIRELPSGTFFCTYCASLINFGTICINLGTTHHSNMYISDILH